MLEIPYNENWLPEAVIFKDKLYYTVGQKVICYDIDEKTANEVYISNEDKYLSLVCNNSELFIIERTVDKNAKIVTVSLTDDQYLDSTIVPAEFCSGGNYFIVDGVFLSGNGSLEEILAYNISEKRGFHIKFNGK